MENTIDHPKLLIRKIINRTPIPTFSWQKTGNDLILVDYNESAVEFTGGNVKNFLGINASELYKNNFEIFKDLLRCINEKVDFSKELIYTFQITGEQKDLRVKYVYLPPDMVLVYSEDISEYKQKLLELKSKTEKLKESEDNFRILYKEAPNAYFSVGVDKSIRRCNNAASTLTGYTNEELMNFKIFDLYADTPDGLDKAKKVFQRFLKGEVIQDKELQMKRKDGNIVWISLSVNPIIDKSGKVMESRSMIVDITERKKVEENLYYNARLIENLNDAIISVDLEFNIISWNHAAELMYGLKSNDVIGKNVTNILPLEIANSEIEEALQSLKTSGFWGGEFSYTRKDGTLVNILSSISQIKDISGKRLGFVAINTDITEKVKIEQELKESENKLDHIFTATPSHIYIYDFKKNQNVYSNKYLKIMLGYSTEELQSFGGSALANLIHPDDKELLNKMIQDLLNAKDDDVIEGEYRFRKKDGEFITIIDRAIVFKRTSEGDVSQIIGSAIDITKQKKYEQALTESEEKFHGFFDFSNIGLAITSVEKGWLYTNDHIIQILGYPREELYEKTWAEITHPEDLQSDVKQFNKVLDGKIDDYQLDKRFIKKNGEIVYTHLTVSCIRNSDGSVKHILATLQDITVRKKAEEQASDLARFPSENPNPVLRVSKEFVIYINQAGQNIFKIKEGERIPLIFRQYVNQVFEERIKDEIEAEFDNKRFSFVIAPVKDTGYVNIYGIDITIRKKMEEELKESERKFRNIAEQNLMGIGILQDNVIKYINQAMADIYGYTIDEVLNWEPMEFFKIFAPDSLETVKEQAIKKQSGDPTQKVHYVVHGVKKTGELVWIDNSSRTITYEGRPADLVTQIDISEKVKAEQALLESEDHLEYLLSSSPTVLYTASISGDYGTNYISNNVKDQWGYDPEDLINDPGFWIDCVHPDDRERVESEVSTIFEKEHIFYDYRLKHKNGTYHWMRDEAKLVRDDDGNPIEMIGSLMDISESKIAELNLRESEEKFRKIFESIPDMFFMVSADGTILEYNGEEDELYVPPEVFLGKKLQEVLPKDVSEKFYVALNNTMKSQLPNIIEYELIVNNELKFYEGRSLYFSKDQMAVFIRNISKRKIAVINLRDSEKKYRELVENISDAIISTDVEFNIQSWNSGAEKIYGYKTSEVIGKSVRDVIPVEFSETTEEEVVKNFRENGFWKGPGTQRHKNGTIIHVLSSSALIKDVNGNPISVVTVNKDITDRIKAENEILKAHSELDQIFNSSAPLCIIDTNHNIIQVNDTFCSLVRIKEEDLIGKKCHEIVPDKFCHTEECPLNELLDGKEYKKYEKDKILDDGSRLTYIMKAVPYKNSNDDIIGIIENYTDISARKNVEFQLIESATKYRNILENIKEGYFEFDLNNKLTFLNIAFSEITGYSHDELVGNNFEILVSKETNKTIQDLLNTIHKTPIEQALQFEVLKKNGEIIIVDCSLYLKYDLNGKVIGFCGFSRDITDKKKAELVIKNEIDKLKQIDQIRSDLVRRASHELKTPLISIYSASQYLLNELNDELSHDVKKFVQLINEGGERLRQLTDNLLDVFTLESKELTLDKERHNLTDITKNCVDKLSHQMQKREHDLDFRFDKDTFIEIDKLRIEQVIKHTISNAVKNTPPKGLIQVYLKNYEKNVEIRVIDNGVGFTTEEKEMIFKKFGKIERYGRGMYLDTEGSGLGLYISKEIVELHGGSIKLESEGRDKGTTVIIKLPFQQ